MDHPIPEFPIDDADAVEVVETADEAAPVADPAVDPAAASAESRQRFIARAIEQEVVWFLESDEAAAYVESATEEDEIVLLFWSDRADAKRARKTQFKEYEVAEVSLLEFTFKWLPGMAEDEVLAGVNWTVGNPAGPELDPEQLQDDLLEAMGEEMCAAYYDALQSALDPAEEPDAPDAPDATDQQPTTL